MKFNLKYPLLIAMICLFFFACKQKDGKGNSEKRVLKGLYIFGPEMKSFTDCNGENEYWVADSAKTLELEYSKMNIEKPYSPVYVEFEGIIVPSDTSMVSDFDSTVVVSKLLKITQKIPDGPCGQ